MFYRKSSDCFLQRKIEREQVFRKLGQCPFKWTSRFNDEAHEVHRCKTFKGHRANHRCNCGAQRKLNVGNSERSNDSRSDTPPNSKQEEHSESS